MKFETEILPRLQFISGSISVGEGDVRAHVAEARQILRSVEYNKGLSVLGKLCWMMPTDRVNEKMVPMKNRYVQALFDLTLGLKNVAIGTENRRLEDHAESLNYATGEFVETFLDDISEAFAGGRAAAYV